MINSKEKMTKVLPDQTKTKVFERDKFTCQKCNFQNLSSNELEIHHINQKVDGGNENLTNLITLCSICHNYVPDSPEDFSRYINEKVDGKSLETFRKSNRSISKRTILGMQNQFLGGKHLTKAPRGYKLLNKDLIINQEEAEIVKKIFEEFLNSNVSLTQLAKKNGMTTSGLIKLLKNTTYLGKVKFANHETDGQHEPIISQQLFEQVGGKLQL